MTRLWWGVLLLLLTACSQEDMPSGRQQAPLPYVQAVQARPLGQPATETFAATVKAAQTVRLGFRVAGRISALPVTLGAPVAAGEVVARLDATDYRLQYEQQQAQLRQAQAQKQKARRDYVRIKQLFAQGHAAKREFDAAQSAWHSARARVEALHKAVRLAQQRLQYTRLKAPFAAWVGAKLQEAGENTAPQQAVIMLHARHKPLELEMRLPEKWYADVALGQEVPVAFPALESQVQAHIKEKDAAAEPAGQGFLLRLQLPKKVPDVRPGMAADVSLQPQTQATGQVMVPSTAVGADRQGTYVLVLRPATENGPLWRLQRHKVTAGRLRRQGLVLRAGLQPGTTILKSGLRRFQDGQKVRLAEESAAP